MEKLRDDGERFLPETMGGITALEHVHRYLFALQLSPGRRVLDIASGEGYGTSLLADRSVHACGVDIDSKAVAHASSKYCRPDRPLEFLVGDCENIPLPSQSIDLAVSFETIEHHDRHEEMLVEIKRVLQPDGLAVISTPDRREYSERTGFSNPFHVQELDESEFLDLMQRHFRHVRLLRQRVLGGSWIVEDVPTGSLDFFRSGQGVVASSGLAEAPYLLAVASDEPLPAIKGGSLEQDLASLAAPMLREVYRVVTQLIQAVALPDSAVLRERLQDPWYLRANPDLATPGLDRLDHWLTNGAAECRLPAEDLPLLIRELVAERMGTVDDPRRHHANPALIAHEALRWESAHARSLALSDKLGALQVGLGYVLTEWKRQVTRRDDTHQTVLDSLRRDLDRHLEQLHNDVAVAVQGAAAHSQAVEETVGLALTAMRTDAVEQAQVREAQWSQAQAELSQQLEGLRSQHAQALAAERARWHDEHTAAQLRESGLRQQLLTMTDGHQTERTAWTVQRAELERQRQESLLSLQREHAERLAAERGLAASLESERTKQVGALQQDLRDANSSLAELGLRFSQERESLTAALQQRTQDLHDTQGHLALLQNSRSWRWTSLLRALGRKLFGSDVQAKGRS